MGLRALLAFMVVGLSGWMHEVRAQEAAATPVVVTVPAHRAERDVRGRGRATERLADWLDLVFSVVFLVCMVFVLRLLRTEGPGRLRPR